MNSFFITYFQLGEDIDPRRMEKVSWLPRLEKLPMCFVLWAGRDYPQFLYDLLTKRIWYQLTHVQRIHLAYLLSTQRVDLAGYVSSFIPTEGALQNLWESTVLAMVRDQIEGDGLLLAEEGSASDLRRHYSALLLKPGPCLASALDLLCKADQQLSAHGRGARVVGPSTLRTRNYGWIQLGVLSQSEDVPIPGCISKETTYASRDRHIWPKSVKGRLQYDDRSVFSVVSAAHVVAPGYPESNAVFEERMACHGGSVIVAQPASSCEIVVVRDMPPTSYLELLSA